MGVPIMCQLVVSDALAADFIIVGTGSDGGLPATVTNWIDRWIGAETTHPVLLMGLVNTNEPSLFSNRSFQFSETVLISLRQTGSRSPSESSSR